MDRRQEIRRDCPQQIRGENKIANSGKAIDDFNRYGIIGYGGDALTGGRISRRPGHAEARPRIASAIEDEFFLASVSTERRERSFSRGEKARMRAFPNPLSAAPPSFLS